tara:strand:- start:26313 stop:26531 length:219 start_codon:yes stop_codon:yes gene_type:complete
MKLLLFKTDIKTKKKVKSLQPLFSKHTIITNWSVDTEDIDNVLRIETNQHLQESEIIDLINSSGFKCEPLDD